MKQEQIAKEFGFKADRYYTAEEKMIRHSREGVPLCSVLVYGDSV